MPLMDTPAAQISYSNESANSALIALACLLGRQAAREFAEAEQGDHDIPLIKDEGVGNDQP
jgi:hypothetical protein